MSEQSRILRGSVRAIVGLLVVGVSATAIVLLGSVTLPAVNREPLALAVDTTHNTDRTLVCAGSFSELGADPSRPGVAIPTSAPAVTVAGAASETSELARSEGGEGLPTVLKAPVNEVFAAAQIQAVQTETLRGVAASACTEPLNEQWLLGGSSTIGVSTTLSLANPGEVPATVQITVFDESGEVDAVQTAAVLVSPGTEQTISLNGYAPERERLAVRIVSTGAPVSATLGVGHLEGITPYAVDTVTAQAAPSKTLVVPGVANVSEHEQGAGDVGEADLFGVEVRVLAPGGEAGTATARAIDAKGNATVLGEIQLASSGIGELYVEHWPEGANAVVIEADVPVIAGVLGSAQAGKERDYTWFTPAPFSRLIPRLPFPW
ncbi:DUF5719 family protein [Leucobacter insecticola]|uniref:DUF5719 family protein n=1 Tax=Leucobacter insecticola TaxID=2714934 RepID=UPI001FCB944A|nr:DUF5719 family protein [Leucobacter insecticola]